LKRIRGLYAERHPGWSVVVAEAPPGLWVKARAVMPAVAAAPADELLLVADADVWCGGLARAVEGIEEDASWAIPHSGVFRLSEEATAAVLAGTELDGDLPLEQRPYKGTEGGGLVIARREALLEVPVDPRFRGWGQEDESWGYALRTLLGAPWRGREPLLHLWHPPQERAERARGSREGWELRKRYHAAFRHPEGMRDLTEEAKLALAAAEPTLHPDPA